MKRSERSDFLFENISSPKVSIDSVLAYVISDMESIFILQEEQKTSAKAFLNVKDVFALP